MAGVFGYPRLFLAFCVGIYIDEKVREVERVAVVHLYLFVVILNGCEPVMI